MIRHFQCRHPDRIPITGLTRRLGPRPRYWVRYRSDLVLHWYPDISPGTCCTSWRYRAQDSVAFDGSLVCLISTGQLHLHGSVLLLRRTWHFCRQRVAEHTSISAPLVYGTIRLLARPSLTGWLICRLQRSGSFALTEHHNARQVIWVRCEYPRFTRDHVHSV